MLNVYGVLFCNGLGIICGMVIGMLLVDMIVGKCYELIDFLLFIFGFNCLLLELFLFIGVNVNFWFG